MKQEKLIIDDVVYNPLFYKEFDKTYVFSTYSETVNDSRIVAESYEGLRHSAIPGRIVKSDIQNAVIKQLKNMLNEVKDYGEQILYLTMNKNTKNFFRMYYSYEVDYIPKNLSNEDKQVGKIVGSIMGVKIFINDCIGDYVVKPIVRNNLVKKFSKIFD